MPRRAGIETGLRSNRRVANLKEEIKEVCVSS